LAGQDILDNYGTIDHERRATHCGVKSGLWRNTQPFSTEHSSN